MLLADASDTASVFTPMRRRTSDPCLAFVFLYLIGIVLAVRLARYAPTELCAELADTRASEIGRSISLSIADFFPAFAAVFLSTSTVGFLLLPLLFLIRGFRLSSAVVGMLLAGVSFGRIVLILVLPSFISLFGLLLLCGEAFRLSERCVTRFRFVPCRYLPACVFLTTISSLLREVLLTVLL